MELLKGLDNRPISYLVSDVKTMVNTHVGPVPVGSGLATHVSPLVIFNARWHKICYERTNEPNLNN